MYQAVIISHPRQTYISKLYKLETDMKEAYPIIRDFKKWMNSVASRFTPKSRIGKAIV